MEKVFFTLIFSVMTVNFALAADDTDRYMRECLSIISAPKVKVTSSYGKLKYNFEKDSRYLREETARKYKEKGLEIPEGFEPVGLTKVRDGFTVNMNVGQAEISHGYMCLYPQNIDVHLGFYVPTIYILKDLDKSSCTYEVALRHEKTHMQIYLEALDYFLPELKEASDGLFEKVGVRVAAPDEHTPTIAEQLHEDYVNALNEKVEAWRQEVEAEQLKLDTPEQYLLESKLCERVEAARKR